MNVQQSHLRWAASPALVSMLLMGACSSSAPPQERDGQSLRSKTNDESARKTEDQPFTDESKNSLVDPMLILIQGASIKGEWPSVTFDCA